MEDFSENQQSQNFSPEINIKGLLFKYLLYWKWYVLSVVFFLILVNIYLRYSFTVYNASTNIIIKNEDKASMTENSVISEFNFFSNYRSQISNEIQKLKSRDLSQRVIKKLGFDFSYFVEGRFINIELYNNTPFKINFISKKNNFDEKDTIFIYRPINDTYFLLLAIWDNLYRVCDIPYTILTVFLCYYPYLF